MSHLLANRHAIASSYQDCMLSFDRLFEILEHSRQLGVISQNLDPDLSEGEKLEYSRLQEMQLDDNLGRFKVWGENCGAHRHGRVSLDHRLREAADVKQMVLELQDDLNSDLKHAIAIVSGETLFEQPDEDAELLSDSDSSQSSLEDEGATSQSEPAADINTKSRLEECVTDITHVITCLYKFSITIQNPAPRDRLAKCSSIPVSHFEEFDIRHLSHKFPDAQRYLIERLGKANTKRRQLLKYYEMHHEKIAGHYGAQIDGPLPDPVLRAATGNDLDGGLGGTAEAIERPTPSEGPATIATRPTQTTVSVYVAPDVSHANAYSETDDQSQTSYASSTSGGPANLQVPLPPKQESAFDGEPFQCPFCFVIISVSGRQSWKRHVFRDFRPYLCTFQGCQKSEHLFDNQHDWFQHELDIHRKEWFCNACDRSDDLQKTYSSRQFFQNHLEKIHSSLFLSAQIQTVIDRCERPVALEQICPLCGGKHLPSRLQRHLGGHMQQIALFVAKSFGPEPDSDSESVGAQVGQCESESRSSSDLEFASNPSRHSDIDSEEHMPSENFVSKETDSKPQPEQQSDMVVATEGTTKNEDETTALRDAVMRGKEATVRLLLEEGVNVDAKDKDRQTALHLAAASGLETMVRLLLEKGARIEACDKDNKTPLHYAAARGNEATIRLLLEKGAEIEAIDASGQTALHIAAASGREDTIRLLLKKGAEPDVLDDEEQTALHLAAASDHAATIQLLLENGADVESKKWGEETTALHIAAASGHQSTVRLLLKNGANIETRNRDEQTALHFAASNGHDAMVRLLLEKGADIEAKDDTLSGWTALHLAVEGGHRDVVRVLLGNGAHIDTIGSKGMKVLHVAALKGYEAMVRLLLENGADVESKKWGEEATALHLAAANGHESTVRLLLEKDADVNSRTSQQLTALHLAALSGHETTVRLLLEKGVEIDARDQVGLQALQLAADRGHEATVRLLLEKGADIKTM